MSNLLFVAAAAFLVTLASGLGALYLRNHKAWVFAFCSGALIGSAVILLLPDARDLLEESTSAVSADLVWLACALGFTSFFLFERGAHGDESARLAGLGGVIGLATHSLFDGFVIGQGFRAGEDIGLTLALAVMLHKLADGVSAVGVMLGTKHSVRETTLVLVVIAIAPALGAAAQSVLVVPGSILALLLAWFAGMFLYLGANRLLPEARRASESIAVPLLSVTGIAMAFVAKILWH